MTHDEKAQDEELSDYTVTIDGIEHTMQLSEEGAAAYGENAKRTRGGSSSSGGSAEKPKAATQSSKVATPPNKNA